MINQHVRDRKQKGNTASKYGIMIGRERNYYPKHVSKRLTANNDPVSFNQSRKRNEDAIVFGQDDTRELISENIRVVPLGTDFVARKRPVNPNVRIISRDENNISRRGVPELNPTRIVQLVDEQRRNMLFNEGGEEQGRLRHHAPNDELTRSNVSDVIATQLIASRTRPMDAQERIVVLADNEHRQRGHDVVVGAVGPGAMDGSNDRATQQHAHTGPRNASINTSRDLIDGTSHRQDVLRPSGVGSRPIAWHAGLSPPPLTASPVITKSNKHELYSTTMRAPPGVSSMDVDKSGPLIGAKRIQRHASAPSAVSAPRSIENIGHLLPGFQVTSRSAKLYPNNSTAVAEPSYNATAPFNIHHNIEHKSVTPTVLKLQTPPVALWSAPTATKFVEDRAMLAPPAMAHASHGLVKISGPTDVSGPVQETTRTTDQHVSSRPRQPFPRDGTFVEHSGVHGADFKTKHGQTNGNPAAYRPFVVHSTQLPPESAFLNSSSNNFAKAAMKDRVFSLVTGPDLSGTLFNQSSHAGGAVRTRDEASRHKTHNAIIGDMAQNTSTVVLRDTPRLGEGIAESNNRAFGNTARGAVAVDVPSRNISGSSFSLASRPDMLATLQSKRRRLDDEEAQSVVSVSGLQQLMH